MAKNTEKNAKEYNRRAREKYTKENFVKKAIYLKVGEDDDLLDDINQAQANGISSRQWLRNLYENQK